MVPWPQVQLAAIAPHVVSFIRAQGIQCNVGGHPAPVRPSPGPWPRIFPAPGSAAPALCPRVRGAPPPPSHVGTQLPAPSLGPPGSRSPVRTRAAAGPPPVDWLGLPCSPPMGARLRGWRLAGRARLPLQTETKREEGRLGDDVAPPTPLSPSSLMDTYNPSTREAATIPGCMSGLTEKEGGCGCSRDGTKPRETWYGGARLQSQHVRGGGRRIRNSRLFFGCVVSSRSA